MRSVFANWIFPSVVCLSLTFACADQGADGDSVSAQGGSGVAGSSISAGLGGARQAGGVGGLSPSGGVSPIGAGGSSQAGRANAGSPNAGAPQAGQGGASACVRHQDCSDGVFCNGEERCVAETTGAKLRGCKPALVGACAAGTLCNESQVRCVSECSVAQQEVALAFEVPPASWSMLPEERPFLVVAAPVDRDGDGSYNNRDCDDANAARYPGNTEVCDVQGVDEDCNLTTFAGPEGDQDSDGFVSSLCCNNANNCGYDCDDTHSNIKPGVLETCNHIDDNCNGFIDEGVTQDGFRDQDGDGFGDPVCSTKVCGVEQGYVLNGNDCDDTRPAVSVGRQVCAPDARGVLLCTTQAVWKPLACPEGQTCASQPDGTGRCE